MQLEKITYRRQGGWQGALPVHLDGAHTLLLAFGASEFADDPAPFAALAEAFPQSLLVGCSTSGEIAGSEVNDGSISVAVVRFEHTTLRHALVEVGAPRATASPTARSRWSRCCRTKPS